MENLEQETGALGQIRSPMIDDEDVFKDVIALSASV